MSESDDTASHSGEQTINSQPRIRRAKTDPLVSCPVVFGEYMRASGFFFTANRETYLITARHNALPTNSKQLATGDVSLSYQTEQVLPEIDIYLQTATGCTVQRYDIRSVDGVKQTPEIDVLGVPIDFNPAEYGYHVWSADEIESPSNSTATLDIIGFDGVSFPDSKDYDIDIYREGIESPAVLRIVNEMREYDDPSRFGLIAVGADEEVVGEGSTYTGLSGSPVIGSELAGVHILNWQMPQEAQAMTEGDEFTMMVYARTPILPKLLE